MVSFGVMKFIHEKFDCDIYGIADITDKPKIFFLNQKLVPLVKIWFYHDYVSKKNKNPDLKYLSYIEERYKINLWLLASNERIFSKFNNFYKFSNNEILCILEQECRLFEQILEEVKPDFVIMGLTVLHNDHLFYEMCKAKGIKTLILTHTIFPYLYMIVDDIDATLNIKNYNNTTTMTVAELQNFLKRFDPTNQARKYKTTFQNSKLTYFKAALKFLTSSNTNVKTHYTYFGRTKFQVIVKMLIYTLKKQYREFFMNRNLNYNIDDSYPFIYFPLHIEQERTLLLGAPFYTNQLEILTNISKSLPIGYKLIVKEHPIMIFRGWRSISDYKHIMALPNVVLLHPSVNSDEIIKKCSLVVSINGTAALQAAFYQKPSILFVDKDSSSFLPSVYCINSIEELPQAIRISLKKEVNTEALSKYVNFIKENSFNCDIPKLGTASQNYFQYGGFLMDVDVTLTKMESFLSENRTSFELIADQFIKKIQNYKKLH